MSEACDEPAPHTPERSQSQQDTTSEKMRKFNNALSAGLKQPREMGMREMDQVGCIQYVFMAMEIDFPQYISKINKQNFDLKLEVFHRTQQIAVLAKKLERMQELEEELKRLHGLEDEVQKLRNAAEDNQRLRESNDVLRNEIVKRDHAVTEAVELICQLETKVEGLETDRSLSRPSTARPYTSDGSDTPTPKTGAVIDVPERTSSKRATAFRKHRRVPSDSPSLERAPSFLRTENESTAALRALFVPSEAPSNSTLSVLTKMGSSNSMNGVTEVESPRISTLSECSELNPCDSPTKSNCLEQLDIPIRKTWTPESSPSSRLCKEEENRNDRVSGWMLPQADISPVKSLKQKNLALNGFYRAANTPSPEDDLNLDGQSQKSPEAMFGDPRLPPTPDTMCTALANSTKHSNGSLSMRECHAEDLLTKRRIVYSRSADDLRPRGSSSNSALPDSMDANVSGATPSALKTDGKDDTPAIFPFHGLPSKRARLFSPGAYNIPSFGYYGGTAACDESIEVSTTARTSMSDGSCSPTLAAYDWVEAAKAGPRSRKERTDKIGNDEVRAGSSSTNLGSLGTRTPNQSSSMVRRHSLGSTVRENEPAGVPTLDLSSLDPSPQARPERESRRRISFRPPFFGRSIKNPLRFQSSGVCDAAEPDDGAPSPVVRKTRQTNRIQTKGEPDTHGPDLGQDDICMYSCSCVDNGDNLHKALPHSFTESNIQTNGAAARPSTTDGKDHKRRSSLAIIGWMKEASGIGSHRKHESSSPGTTTRPHTMMSKEKVPLRYGSEGFYDGLGTGPEFSDRHTLTVANPDSPEIASRAQYGVRTDDQDQRRRPRYIERRRRL